MPSPSEDEDSIELCDRVDEALESLWHGNPDRLECLLGMSGAGRAATVPTSWPASWPTIDATDAIGPGFEIGAFRIVREIARGGMGIVYEAREPDAGRTVAIKVLLAGPFASQLAQRRFQREVKLAASLRHPHIVHIIESGQLESGQPYYAMEHVVGVPLDRYTADVGADRRRILELFGVLCDAVHHAHAHGVVHRDLKPGNVLVDADGQPHVLDFGLAKSVGPGDPASMVLSAPGAFLGTPRYVAPEQAAGRLDAIDARTDVFALGVMLYEAITGQAPFDDSATPGEMLERILHAEPVPPSARIPSVDGRLEAIILRALEKDQDLRYPSARDFAEDLRRYLRGDRVRATGSQHLRAVRSLVARHRVRAALALAVPLLAALILVGWAWRLRLEHHAVVDLAMSAERNVQTGQLDDADTVADRLIERYRDHPLARVSATRTYLALARAENADDRETTLLRSLRADIDEDPARYWASGELLADVQRENGDVAEAEKTAAGVRGLAPDDAEAWFIRSFATMSPDLAVEHIRSTLTRDPRYPRANERLAYLCWYAGDFEGAVAAADALLAGGENRVTWHQFKGRALAWLKRYPEAVGQFDLAIAADPTRYLSYRSRGVVHLCAKEYDRAIDDLTIARKLYGPSSVWERYQLATPLWITGRYAEAAQNYKESRAGLGASYANIRHYLVLCDMARHLDHDEETVHLAAMVLDAARKSARDERVSSILACLAGKRPPSDLADEAERTDPKNMEARCELFYYAAEAALLRGEPEDARTWFRRCSETGVILDPDNPYLDPMNEYHLATWRLDCFDRGELP
ncbi:MAG: protein kinase [Planctomycetes bacterium]|nr:protein kinase [Planctomycetota bacterium]